MEMTWLSEYSTDLGHGAVAATEHGVCQVWLPSDSLASRWTSHKRPGESEFSRMAAKQLEYYFKNELQHFDVKIDISSLTEFRQHILQLAMNIPYGMVTTYGQLAVQAGAPGAARAVGGALAANPIPIIIPCHRVIAASGALTGFSGTGGILMKKFLLDLEGVDLTAVSQV